MLSASQVSLSLDSVSVERGNQAVLTEIDISLTEASRMAIVGPNGVGKSTLLKVISGQLAPDAGSVSLAPNSLRVGLVRQELDRSSEESGHEYLKRVLGISTADSELEAASAGLGQGEDSANDRYELALQNWLDLGVADFDSRAKEVADDLGLDEHLLNQPTETLSGGEAARVGMAAVLLSTYDITLLDEPTNDLDLAGLERLERWVKGHRGGIVLVSHDREFLERTVTSVFELDEHSHRGSMFNGGWAAYLEERETQKRHAQEKYGTYVDERDRLSSRSQTQREWASQGLSRAKKSPSDPDKFVRNFKIDSTEKLAGKAAATKKALERLEVVEKPWEGWDLQFTVASAPRSATVVASLANAVFRRGEFQLGPINLEIQWADRLGIAGANGSGKSTLIGGILGRFPAVEGISKLGSGVIVGEMDQARELFDRPDGTPLIEVFQEETGLINSECRSVLAKFGLTASDVERPVANLSPGERTRSQLALFQARGVNLLVLDEPTNHLDLAAIEQLESAIGNFDGTIILVSHDRRFLESVELTQTLEL